MYLDLTRVLFFMSALSKAVSVTGVIVFIFKLL
jgi:hypothetical protein